MTNNVLEASFRDPSGFIFKQNDVLYRQINTPYKEDYDLFLKSGLYQKLIDKNYLVSHEEVGNFSEVAYKTIKPDLIDFISYPYEWSFSMLKDAALLTLKIQKIAVKNEMSLKDASAYNVQFQDGKPIFIDTLSFEKFAEKPWIAYAQFCRHFLAPLLLASYVDIRLTTLLRDYIDGIPIDLASKLLPAKTKFNPSILMHIHLQAKTIAKYEGNSTVNIKTLKMSKNNQLALLDSLKDLVNSLKWQPKGTEWGDYYTFTNYSDEAMQNKGELVKSFVEKINPKTCWDLGANNGYFTRIASDKGIPSVAFDIDPIAVEKNYLQIKNENEKNIIPLIVDLTNPSPAIGWNCRERESLISRNKVDIVFALALIHHLAISNNLPFKKIAEFFAGICNNLIIEFVPKKDSKVKILLSTREDIFPEYDEKNFKKAFLNYFRLVDKKEILNSERTLYLFSK